MGAASTISDMGKKKTGEESRPPSWAVYARLDPDLKQAFEDYQQLFEYQPELARVIERALKRLFEEAGVWPRKAKKNGH
jgi:hypothetical protein